MIPLPHPFIALDRRTVPYLDPVQPVSVRLSDPHRVDLSDQAVGRAADACVAASAATASGRTLRKATIHGLWLWVRKHGIQILHIHRDGFDCAEGLIPLIHGSDPDLPAGTHACDRQVGPDRIAEPGTLLVGIVVALGRGVVPVQDGSRPHPDPQHLSAHLEAVVALLLGLILRVMVIVGVVMGGWRRGRRGQPPGLDQLGRISSTGIHCVDDVVCRFEGAKDDERPVEPLAAENVRGRLDHNADLTHWLRSVSPAACAVRYTVVGVHLVVVVVAISGRWNNKLLIVRYRSWISVDWRGASR
ncbi:hypothetical protein PG996_002463 [Apiospora saccharicola]|uniref:Uncharacterized protein n=1 Tax=Apiospora saccharicola TaxID=335842 RepID=A0ABR1WJL7_9PEZI